MELIKIRFGEETDLIETAVEKNLTDLFRSANLLFRCSDCLWLPAIDMIESAREIVVIVDVAGVDKEDLDVEITPRAVKVSGRRRSPAAGAPATYRLAEIHYGRFERVLHLPETIDADSTGASYSEGFLTIRLAKQPAPERYRIPIVEE
ncbi:MAG: Hsp20/alpha crystallin family protein [Desulfobacterales bacterium]